MKSFQSLYTDLEELTGENSAIKIARFKKDIAETNNIVLSMQPWQFLDYTKNVPAVANQQNYAIPNSMLKTLTSVTVYYSGTNGVPVRYRPKPVENPKFWEYLQSLRVIVSSNITQFYFRQGNQVYLWPTPQSADLTITFRGRKRPVDLSLDDYSAGTIVSVANNATLVTGSGTAWGAGAVGNKIRINYTSGDFQWYEIDSIASATTLNLFAPYEGTAIAAGSATYTIGEFSDIPGEFHDILIYRPLALYYARMENLTMAKQNWIQYDGGKEAGYISRVSRAGGLVGTLMDNYSENFSGAFLEEEQPTEPSTQDLIIKNFDFKGESWN